MVFTENRKPRTENRLLWLWLVRLILALWGLQVLWLFWHFGPEAGEVARRAAHGNIGAAIRQEDPLYRWATALKVVIPENAAYVFLDDYAAGKEIEVRYYMAPRRHILMSPEVPASFLFSRLHQENASFLLLRESAQSLGPGVQAALQSPAFHRLNLPGPGQVFRVDAKLLHWGFYD
ncbi:MAG: hypothetical protein ACOZFS_06785 [Thermodesulfobacteriota bacterium]